MRQPNTSCHTSATHASNTDLDFLGKELRIKWWPSNVSKVLNEKWCPALTTISFLVSLLSNREILKHLRSLKVSPRRNWLWNAPNDVIHQSVSVGRVTLPCRPMRASLYSLQRVMRVIRCTECTITSGFWDKPCRLLKVLQRSGRHCSYHLQSKCL
jgi:hypothetical protein